MHQLTVSVADLIGRPGSYRDFTIVRPLHGVETTLARLSDHPLRATLRAEGVVEGILVTGRVEGTTALVCARCLKGLPGQLALEVCEMFVASGAAGDDAYRLTGTEIHLEEMLRDAVTLALPLNPLCDAECRGLCARCGADLNAASCDCGDDDTDPRWAALSALRGRL